MNELLEKVRGFLPPDRVQLIHDAYVFAASSHEGQTRVSGEPFIDHPTQTALYLADLKMDATTIAAALLHDVIEDCGVTFAELEQRFSVEIAKLVDGVTNLGSIDRKAEIARLAQQPNGSSIQAASLRKMLVAMAKDVRVVLIKLADRLHNMQTLSALSSQRRLAIAQETLDIYTPLAHRLGIWDIKWQLEDMSFRYLNPIQYKTISKLLSTRREEREVYIEGVSHILNQALEQAAVKAQVTGRAKHIYSIYQKMQVYASQGKAFHDIYDLSALRVLVQEKQDCYAALGIVHSLWHPLSGQFDDYIAKPKENMYQALHTAVMGPQTKPLEVQIKTFAMHEVAEHGVAAHWLYKAVEDNKDTKFEEKMTWLRQLLEWQQEVSESEEFMETVKTDLFPDQLFVYTPKGEVKELPAGSTPIDFAYRIHTELGHQAVGAKVNGKLVSLDTPLHNSETVEILTSKVTRGPSLDWLNPNLSYVKSGNAREKIRAWFRKQEQGTNVERGQELMAKEFRRLNVTFEHKDVADLFGYNTVDSFLASLGNGTITTNQLDARLTPQPEPAHEYRPPSINSTSGIQIQGTGDLLTHFAHCCSPIPGDAIIGYITRSRGISVHLKDCQNILGRDDPSRHVNVAWGATRHLYPVRLRIDAWDRVGLLRDITTVASEDKVNIASLITEENVDEGTATIALTLFTSSIDQLSRLFTKLEGINGVTSVSRFGLPNSNPSLPQPNNSTLSTEVS